MTDRAKQLIDEQVSENLRQAFANDATSLVEHFAYDPDTDADFDEYATELVKDYALKDACAIWDILAEIGIDYIEER